MPDWAVPVILSTLAALGAAGSGWFAARQSRKATVAVAIKNDQVEKYKIKVDSDTHRLDQVFEQQQKIIDTLTEQNKTQGLAMVAQDEKIENMRARMEGCLDERQELKLLVVDQGHQIKLNTANYNALEAQFKNVQAFNRRATDDHINGDTIHSGDQVQIQKPSK